MDSKIIEIEQLQKQISELKRRLNTCRVEAGSKYSSNPVIAALQKELYASIVKRDEVGGTILINRLNKAVLKRYNRDIRDLQLQIVEICKDIYSEQKYLIDRCAPDVNALCLKQVADLELFDVRFDVIVGFFTRIPVKVPMLVNKPASAVGSLISKFEQLKN